MAERIRLEIAYSHDGVSVRVIAKCGGLYPRSGYTKLAGSLTPEEAIAFAEALRAKAEEVAASNDKRAKAEAKRRERLSKLPTISWR